MERKSFVWSDGLRRELLPIDFYLEAILALLEKNQVIIVEGQTGSGKSTRIPQAILDRLNTQITITQPRRPVVRWISKRIAFELDCILGSTVGYKLFGEQPKQSKTTRCFIRIDQSLANQISRTKKLPEGIIMIDEAHERYAHVSIDALLIHIGELLPTSPNTKVIITSATIDTEKFSEYFNNAPVLKVEGRCFPVEVSVSPLWSGEHHSEGAFRVTEEVLSKFLRRELTIRSTHDENVRILVERGTVIVYLPGEEDIKNGIKHFTKFVELYSDIYPVVAITRESEKANDGKWERKKSEFYVELFACYSKLPASEQDRAQEIDVSENTLRIVFSTDIARVSATFPRVVGVVDSLQVKRRTVDSFGVSDTRKISISMAEAEQGMGRAGRTQSGFYIAVGEEFHSLDEWPVPAILREPLTSVLLQFISAGINPRTCKYLDAPPMENIDVTIKRLQRINALDSDEQITELGMLLLQFPVDPEKALTLIEAEKRGVLAETAIAICLIDTQNIFFTPKQNQKMLVDESVIVKLLSVFVEDYSLKNLPISVSRKGSYYEVDGAILALEIRDIQGARVVADIVRRSWHDSRSDFAALVKAFRAFKAEDFRLRNDFYSLKLTDKREIKENQRKMNQELFGWCKRHGLILPNLRLAEDKLSQLKEAIYNSPLNFSNNIYDDRDFESDDLTKSLISGMFDHIGVETHHGYYSPCGEYTIAHSSNCPKNVAISLFASLRKVHISGKNSFYNLADLASPVKEEWLLEVLPQFCTVAYGDEVDYDERLDKVVSERRLHFNRILISCKTEPCPDHPLATDIFLDWLVANTLAVEV